MDSAKKQVKGIVKKTINAETGKGYFDTYDVTKEKL